MTLHCGIDYSLSSPSICVFDGNKYNILFITTKKSLDCVNLNYKNFNIKSKYIKYDKSVETSRYKLYASTFIEFLNMFKDNDTIIGVEDYAFRATGKVFHIGEHTGVLKYLLNENGYNYIPVAVKEIKQSATGFGNADKELLADYFYKDNGFYMHEQLDKHIKKKILIKKSGNPSSDIVDSYFICKYIIINIDSI